MNHRALALPKWLTRGWLLMGATAVAASLPDISLQNARDPAAPLALSDTTGLRDALRPFQNQPDTPTLRSAVADAVLTHYQAAGWPVTEVSVEPAGAGGGLTAAIHEGRYGEIAVEGGTPWMRQAVAAGWRNKPGAPLTMDDALTGLAWTHRNPLHVVTASFSPGADPATADTTLTLQSDAPVRFFSGWRNDGIEPLGEHRFSAGIEAADLLGLPLWLSLETLTGEDAEAYRAARGSVRFFLPWRHELRVSGQWTGGRTEGIVPGFTSASEVDAWFVSARYLVPLPSLQGWQSELGAGAEFFRTRSSVSVEDLLAEGTADTLHLSAEFNTTRTSGKHRTGLHAEAHWSPGGISPNADDASHEALRRGASADYFLTRAQAWHRYEFAAGWSLTGQTGSQWASTPVLPVQAFSPTGAGAVRGFPEAAFLSDAGVWAGLELASPALAPIKSAAALTLQPVAFVEAAWARDKVSGNEPAPAGAGLGIRLRWSTHAMLSADYGWRLTEPGGRAHLALRVEF
jgi:hemolysin activation/secretion protein